MSVFTEMELKIIDEVLERTFESGDINLDAVKKDIDSSINFILEEIPKEFFEENVSKVGSLYMCLKYFKHILKDM